MDYQKSGRHAVGIDLDYSDIDGFDFLIELSLDLHWSWNHSTDQIWRELDAKLWERTHNPWVILQTVSRGKIESVLGNPFLRDKIDALVDENRRFLITQGWFQKTYPKTDFTCAAYFSMEFMLSEALPIYSGGLGNVAGDQMKAASDLGVPVVGIGLLYQQGYFRQIINKNGVQEALFPYNDPGQLPIKPLRQVDGQWLRLEIALPGYSVWLRAWQVQVGRNMLYLLDSNDPANLPVHRGITSELYGGDSELRLKQEIVLGIGGWRLLKALNIKPEVCHLNEGHAAFAILERAKDFMEENQQSFEVSLAATRVGNLFTTHTAVPAGFDRFSVDLIEQYLGRYASQKLGLSLFDLLALGRQNPQDQLESFNMAYLALHGSGQVNGVSQLHGQVSRHIFGALFPRWPEVEVPIGAVTNGIHTPTWDSAQADSLWTEACGKDRWMGVTNTLDRDIRQIADAKLWQFRNSSRQVLVDYARTRLAEDLAVSGNSSEAVEQAKQVFSADVLTLGFARRFATYKRPNLLLHDPQRLLRILMNRERPVQLILAGKAHPADQPGQALIQQWIKFIRETEARHHVIFLSDDDMYLTQRLVAGVDVWINTPRRPWEACGTSGMKVLVNGGINLSELDGWWAEAYAPELGWAIGDGREHGDDSGWDAFEADELYCLLEKQVVPQFYERDATGIPHQWVAKIRESMALLTPEFSTNRVVREYTEKHYLGAASSYRKRSCDRGAQAKEIIDWQRALETTWTSMRFGNCQVESTSGQHIFTTELFLGKVDCKDVNVQLFANGTESGAIECLEMERTVVPLNNSLPSVFKSTVLTKRPSSDYTARVTPRREEVSVPLELNKILWQK